MRVPRLFIDQPLRTDEPVALDRRTHDHAVKVLRLRAGDRLCLFNGRGGEFAATLTSGPDRTLQALVGEFTPDRTESPLNVRLLQGISRGERMDYTLQKAVELGVGDRLAQPPPGAWTAYIRRRRWSYRRRRDRSDERFPAPDCRLI